MKQYHKFWRQFHPLVATRMRYIGHIICLLFSLDRSVYIVRFLCIWLLYL